MNSIELAAQHPAVREALRTAGWAPEYSTDIKPVVEALSADGYTVDRAGSDALRQLLGLVVEPIMSGNELFGTSTLRFDPLLAATGESPRIKEEREPLVGSSLTPIGEWEPESILLVAEDGSIYGESTFQLFRLGRTLGKALRLLIVADSGPKLIWGRRPWWESG